MLFSLAKPISRLFLEFKQDTNPLERWCNPSQTGFEKYIQVSGGPKSYIVNTLQLCSVRYIGSEIVFCLTRILTFPAVSADFLKLNVETKILSSCSYQADDVLPFAIRKAVLIMFQGYIKFHFLRTSKEQMNTKIVTFLNKNYS